MKYIFYALSLVPLVLVSAFYLNNEYGQGWGTVGMAVMLGGAIIFICPPITLLGLALIGVNTIGVKALDDRKVAGLFVATVVAALPGIIFWIIEYWNR